MTAPETIRWKGSVRYAVPVELLTELADSAETYALAEPVDTFETLGRVWEAVKAVCADFGRVIPEPPEEVE